MDLISELKKAKNGNEQAYHNILSYYKKFAYFTMNKYGVNNKEDCLEVINQRIMKAIWLFDINKQDF